MKALCCAIRVAAVEQGATVAGAFQKIDFADHLVFQQIFIIEHQRLTNQSMDHEFMTGGIYCRNAGMMAFEMQTVRCNGALQVLQGRAGRASARVKRIAKSRLSFQLGICRTAAVRAGTRPGGF